MRFALPSRNAVIQQKRTVFDAPDALRSPRAILALVAGAAINYGATYSAEGGRAALTRAPRKLAGPRSGSGGRGMRRRRFIANSRRVLRNIQTKRERDGREPDTGRA